MKYKNCEIELMSDSEAEAFWPPKKYHVTLPQGKTDGHGATIMYARNLKDAKNAINNAT